MSRVAAGLAGAIALALSYSCDAPKQRKGSAPEASPSAEPAPAPKAEPKTKVEPAKAEPPAAAPVEPPTPEAPDEPPPAIALFDDVTTASVLDAESFAERYPKLRVEEERNKDGELRGLSLDEGTKHILDVSLDADGHPRFGNIRGKAIEIAGTTLRIGATFDEVAEAMPLTTCRAEYGAEPWVICEQGPFSLSWVVGNDLEDASELSVEQARAIVGRHRLESVQFSLPRD